MLFVFNIYNSHITLSFTYVHLDLFLLSSVFPYIQAIVGALEKFDYHDYRNSEKKKASIY